MYLKNFLLDCLFPKQCYGCRKNKTWLCRECFLKIKTYQGEKPRHLKYVDDYFIAGEYKDSILKAIIKAYKFSFNQELKVPLSSLLYNKISYLLSLHSDFLIIPVPLHKSRLRWRGFNQSELIAQEIANLNNYELSNKLIKIKKTKEQALLTESERLINQKDSFQWQGKDLNEQKILLIDDIITSGITISEAALALRKAGAKKIIALALAKG